MSTDNRKDIIRIIDVKKHPSKEIKSAIEYAVERGWSLVEAGSSSHTWGRLKCPFNDKDCRCGEHCIKSVWSTPRNPQNFAKQIRRVVDGCIHVNAKNNNDR